MIQKKELPNMNQILKEVTPNSVDAPSSPKLTIMHNPAKNHRHSVNQPSPLQKSRFANLAKSQRKSALDGS